MAGALTGRLVPGGAGPVVAVGNRIVGRSARGDLPTARAALGADYRHITLNGQTPILKDVDVRHAIFLGINREVLATAALGTLGWEPRVLNNRFLMPEQPGYADNSGEWGKYVSPSA